MMFGLSIAVSLEMGEAAVGGAVGMAHHQNPFGPVKSDRHSDLFQDEILLEVIARRSQCFGTAGDDNHVGALDSLLLQKFPHHHADPMIEAAKHGSIRHILAARGIELKDFAHAILLSNSNRITATSFANSPRHTVELDACGQVGDRVLASLEPFPAE